MEKKLKIINEGWNNGVYCSFFHLFTLSLTPDTIISFSQEYSYFQEKYFMQWYTSKEWNLLLKKSSLKSSVGKVLLFKEQIWKCFKIQMQKQSERWVLNVLGTECMYIFHLENLTEVSALEFSSTFQISL